jgi:hypothetical protein
MLHVDSSLTPPVPPTSLNGGDPQAASAPATTASHWSRVVWLLGWVPLDPQGPPKGNCRHVHVEKDWFEDLVTVATLGLVSPMEVRWDADSCATTPFKNDMVKPADLPPGAPTVPPHNWSKESWLLFGLIPIDGGASVNEGDCPSCQITDFKVQREFHTTDVFETAKSILFSLTFGLVTPLDMSGNANSSPSAQPGTLPPPPSH